MQNDDKRTADASDPEHLVTLSPGHPVTVSPCHPVTPSSCSSRLVLTEVLDQYFREAERGVCDTGNYRCHYYSWGRGPALVFIPGMCDEGLSFVLPIARLKDHFRCIAFDLPDGKDDGAKLGRYHHADHVTDLLALVEHLGLRQAYLFGSSFGSTIALGALGLKPERFPRAVLQGGFARRPLAKAEVMLASWARYWRGHMAALPFRNTLLKTSHEAPFIEREPGVWNFFMQRSGAPLMAAVARRALMIHRTDLRPLLPQIHLPVLLICGDHDPLVGKQCEQELQRGLPLASRAEIENCGHLPQYSHPEVLAEVVTRFLTPEKG
jgi:pimeloyl-ACP methyl ester carboxylesterase